MRAHAAGPRMVIEVRFEPAAERHPLITCRTLLAHVPSAQTVLAMAATISANSGLRDAPPTRKPSISGMAESSAAASDGKAGACERGLRIR